MKVELKNLSGKAYSITILFLLLFVGYGFAMPNPGDKLTVDDGLYGTGNGGEFNLDLLYTQNTVDYVSFCLDKDDPIFFNKNSNVPFFIVDSVVDVSNPKIKEVYWEYTFGDQFGLTKSNDLANWVQDTIWFLAGQIGWNEAFSGSENFYDTYVSTISYFYNENSYNIKALNIYYNYTASDQTVQRYDLQPQIVGEPIPEPTTVLLFCTGLLGLTIFTRRRNKK